jgi:hypothetical protein
MTSLLENLSVNVTVKITTKDALIGHAASFFDLAKKNTPSIGCEAVALNVCRNEQKV